MKLVLLIVVSCFVLHNGKGAPTNAMHKFVRCNPSGGQANCVTQQTPEVPWTPELPANLPASSAQSLEAETIEDESPLMQEDEEDNEEAEEEEGEEEEEDEDKEENQEEENEEDEEGWEDEEDEEGWEEMKEEEENMEDEETPVKSEEAKSVPLLPEDGSGGYEGSADAPVTFGDIGSGELWTEEGMKVVGESQPSEDQAKPAEQELREEHLLNL